MSLEERGAYYGAALWGAMQAGPEVAAIFWEQYGGEFKATMREIAMHRYGLTAAQAAIFAESFDTNKERMAEAITALKMQYAERDAEGNVLMDGARPVLSAKNEQFTDNLAAMIQSATLAGDRAGSYLTPNRNYNLHTRRVVFD